MFTRWNIDRPIQLPFKLIDVLIKVLLCLNLVTNPNTVRLQVDKRNKKETYENFVKKKKRKHKLT